MAGRHRCAPWSIPDWGGGAIMDCRCAGAWLDFWNRTSASSGSAPSPFRKCGGRMQCCPRHLPDPNNRLSNACEDQFARWLLPLAVLPGLGLDFVFSWRLRPFVEGSSRGEFLRGFAWVFRTEARLARWAAATIFPGSLLIGPPPSSWLATLPSSHRLSPRWRVH